jgi:hypothetical protein
MREVHLWTNFFSIPAMSLLAFFGLARAVGLSPTDSAFSSELN